MKKFISIILSVLISINLLTISFAAQSVEPVDIYVTISDRGNLAVAYKCVTVSDADNDGTLTVNDALICAHDKYFDGGSSKGYTYGDSQYGICIKKLWGQTNNNSFGYCLNDESCFSLVDTIKANDHLYAYNFEDAYGFSDSYAFFDIKSNEKNQGESITLSLSSYSYDANWNLVQNNVNNAEITINGKNTGVKTDSNGKATITLDNAGENVISAVSSEGIITPPVCIVNVNEVKKASILDNIKSFFVSIIDFIKSIFNSIFSF